MAKRYYQSCPTCHQQRMHLIGKSSETFGQPAVAADRYYRCLAQS